MDADCGSATLTVKLGLTLTDGVEFFSCAHKGKAKKARPKLRPTATTDFCMIGFTPLDGPEFIRLRDADQRRPLKRPHAR